MEMHDALQGLGSELPIITSTFQVLLEFFSWTNSKPKLYEERDSGKCSLQPQTYMAVVEMVVVGTIVNMVDVNGGKFKLPLEFDSLE